MSVDAAARDSGVVTAVEMMAVALFAVVAVVFLGVLGRLHATSIDVADVAQAASRRASLMPDSASAQREAAAIVASSQLARRCSGGPTTDVRVTPSVDGIWHGGSVTVTVRCRLVERGVLGLLPGARTVAMSDTQPIDRFRR